MAEQFTGVPAVGTPADTSIQTPAMPAPVVAAPVAVTPPAPAAIEPPWLPERIEQAKRSAAAAANADTLKLLGVDSLDAAKAKIAEANKVAESAKTEAQRQVDLAAQHELLKTQNATLLGTLKERATVELKGLNDAQRTAVTELAGDDPGRVLSTIDKLRSNGLLAVAAPATSTTETPQAAKPAPVPAGATTSAAAGAPPASLTSPPNHHLIYEDMKSKNPVAAAQYREAHSREISAARPTQT